MQPFLREQPGYRARAMPGGRAPVGDGPVPALRDHAVRREDRRGRRRRSARSRRPSCMNSYQGLHARLLRPDLRRQAVRRRGALRRTSCSRGAARPALLDVACGTGRHAREFAALGWEVTGVDYQPGPARAARATRSRRSPSARSRTCATLDVAGRAVRRRRRACSTRSATRRTTRRGRRAAGRARHLAPTGLFVVEFLHAPAHARTAPTRCACAAGSCRTAAARAHLARPGSTWPADHARGVRHASSCARTAPTRASASAVEPLLPPAGDARPAAAGRLRSRAGTRRLHGEHRY